MDSPLFKVSVAHRMILPARSATPCLDPCEVRAWGV